MKVLNLYACLGGNRLLWENCEVTAVELDPELARMYQERFPNDTVIVADAHQYLLDSINNGVEWDFVWSSPPCPTHSRARFWSSKGGMYDVQYPDMMLWQEIIFMQNFVECKWVVENVIPYYQPLIHPQQEIGKNLFWSNFVITKCAQSESLHMDSQKAREEFHKIDLSDYKGKQSKVKISRNLVHYDTGLHIFNLAQGIHKANNEQQTTLF